MILISYVESNDRWIRSNNANYATALAGSNLQVNEDNIGVIGQTYASSENMRYIRQYFIEFQHSVPAGQQAVSGFFAIRNNVTHGTNINRNWEILTYNWGTSVTTGNWRTPAQLSALDQSGLLEQTNNNPASRWTYIGHQRVFGELYNSATLRYVMATNRNRTQSSPTQVEYNSVLSSRVSNTSFRPHLVVGTTTLNSMTALIAAQVQLSTGNWMVLERTTTDRVFQLILRHVTPSGSSIIWQSPSATDLTSNDNILGAQSYSMCRDNADNVFVVDPSWSTTDRLNITPFVKGSGNNWTRQSPRIVPLPTDHGRANIQATTCAWHNVGSGRIMALAALDWGRVGGGMISWVLVDSSRIISGSGNWTLSSGRAGDSRVIAQPSNVGRLNPLNSTGTLFDAHADISASHSGYLVTAERSSLLGSTGAISVGRYQIHSNGNQLNTNTTSMMDETGGYSVYDPDAKARVISVGSNRFVKVVADDRPDWGVTLDHFSLSATSTNIVRRGRVQLDSETIPSLPDGATLGATSLWDVVWFPVDNNVWVYYFDDADPRRLMRTSISLSDDLAELNEVEVNATVGATGDIIHAIRVQRNQVNTDEVLVTVARETSGGDHVYDYIVDRINVAPTQPTLIPVSNFDSNLDKVFTWQFNDPNLVDSQTAYQIQIIRTSDSGVEFDSGKVASSSTSHTLTGSSITNNESYTWRVKTWDVADAESPWSNQSTFDTSDTGVVDIIDPSVDNETDIFTTDYLVEWTVTGATPDSYRVVVIRTDDNTTHSDTGWVTGTQTTHLITSLLSDVEYQIRVTTRSSMVESNTATRLITTHYSTPEQPIAVLSVSTELEYIRIAVENPEPRGDRPNPTINQIYRRLYGSDEQFLLVGECPPNSSFRDYTVASGTRYEYKVRAGVEASNQ